MYGKPVLKIIFLYMKVTEEKVYLYCNSSCWLQTRSLALRCLHPSGYSTALLGVAPRASSTSITWELADLQNLRYYPRPTEPESVV